MKKSIRRFCRKHYRGVLASIEIIKRIFRGLFCIGLVTFFALGSSEAPILEVMVQMLLTGLFTGFCFYMSFDEDDLRRMTHEED